MFLLADAVAQRSNCLKQQEAHVFSGRRCSAVADMLAHQPGGRVFESLLWQLKSQVKDIFHALDVLYINGTSNHMFIDPLALDGYIG